MDNKGGGSSRLISTLMRRTGTVDSDVFLDKSSKKEKLRRLSSVGLLGEKNHLSHSINTNSTTNRVKVSKKFYDHCGAINHASAPRKLRSAMKRRESEIGGLSKDCTKKQKAIAEELKMSSVMTKDEEEVAEALFALAQTGFKTTPQVEEVKPLVVEESKPPIPNGKKSLNRCSVHVYICSFIKLLKTKIDQGSSNQVISDTNPQNITNNDYTDIADRPKTTTSQNLMGLHPTNPTFDSLQQVSCCYQNWQNQRYDRMASVSDSKHTQGSLLQERRCISTSEKGKMQLSDEKGGLFSMLNLTL